MFKRVSKRIAKKEEEEALGLDADMKEVLGLQDTDSEESESSSDESDSHSEDSEADSDEASDASAGSTPVTGQKRRRTGEDEYISELAEDLEDETEDSDEEASDEEANDEEAINIPNTYSLTLEEFLNNPILRPEDDSTNTALVRCGTCIDQKLKNEKMVEVHSNSQAHKRRFQRFKALSKGETDLDVVMRKFYAKSSTPSIAHEGNPTSNRALKRKAKIAAIKAKRDLQKIMKAKARAKKEAKAAATASNGATPENGPASDTLLKPKKQKSKTVDHPSSQASAPVRASDPSASKPNKKKRKLDATTKPSTSVLTDAVTGTDASATASLPLDSPVPKTRKSNIQHSNESATSKPAKGKKAVQKTPTAKSNRAATTGKKAGVVKNTRTKAKAM